MSHDFIDNRKLFVIVLMGLTLLLIYIPVYTIAEDVGVYSDYNVTGSIGPTLVYYDDSNDVAVLKYVVVDGDVAIVKQVVYSPVSDSIVSEGTVDGFAATDFGASFTSFGYTRGVYANDTIIALDVVDSNGKVVGVVHMKYPGDTYNMVPYNYHPLINGKLYYDNNDPLRPRYYHLIANDSYFELYTYDGMPSSIDTSQFLSQALPTGERMVDVVAPFNNTVYYVLSNTTVYLKNTTGWFNLGLSLDPNEAVYAGFWRNNMLYVLVGPTEGNTGQPRLYKMPNNVQGNAVDTQDVVSGGDVVAVNYGNEIGKMGTVRVYNYTDTVFIMATGVETGYTSIDDAVKTINLYVYNDTSDTLEMVRYINLTSTVNKGLKPFTDKIYSLVAAAENDFYIAFVASNTTVDTLYFLKAGLTQPVPQAPPAKPQPTQLQTLAMFGGDNETYTLEGMVVEYDDNGVLQGAWLVAGCQEVALIGGDKVPVAGTEGLSIFRVTFNLTANPPLTVQQLLENYSLARVENSQPFLIDNAIVITGATTSYDRGMILVYNTTTGSLDTNSYQGLGPIVGVGTTENPLNPGTPIGFVITNNGTIFYVATNQLPPPDTNSFLYSNYQLPIANWTSGETDGVVFARPLDNALGSYISVVTNTTVNSVDGGILNLYKIDKNGLQPLTTGKGIFYPGVNDSTISIRDTYILNTTDSNNNPYDLVIITVYDTENDEGHIVLYNESNNTFTEPLSASGIAFYGVGFSYTYGPLITGGALNNQTTPPQYQGLVYLPDLDTGTLTPIANLTIPGVNTQIMAVLHVNASYLFTVARTYASPDNLTIAGGTTTTTAPVPEPWMISLVLAAIMITLIGITQKKQ